jgi:surfeit locus 1 family protein
MVPLFSEKESGSRLSKWLLFLPGAITFGLGTWQVLRRQDKVLFFSFISCILPF